MHEFKKTMVVHKSSELYKFLTSHTQVEVINEDSSGMCTLVWEYVDGE